MNDIDSLTSEDAFCLQKHLEDILTNPVRIKNYIELAASGARSEKFKDCREDSLIFLGQLKEARPIIFEKALEEIPTLFIEEIVKKDLSLPFETCYVQFTESTITGKQFVKDGIISFVDAVVVTEVSPNNFVTVTISHRYFPESRRFKLLISPLKGDVAGCMIDLLKVIFSTMTVENTVIEKKTIKVRIRSGKGLESHKIKDIVRVVKNRQTCKPLIGGTIDYSHRFEVMGHWRKCRLIGKNRAGEYNVKGHTWVVPHVKGPDKKDLITKIRMKKGDDGGQSN